MYLQECIDAAKIQPQLQQMKEEAKKQKEEFGVEADAPKGFNGTLPIRGRLRDPSPHAH